MFVVKISLMETETLSNYVSQKLPEPLHLLLVTTYIKTLFRVKNAILGIKI